jgi:hypothetical protein
MYHFIHFFHRIYMTQNSYDVLSMTIIKCIVSLIYNLYSQCIMPATFYLQTSLWGPLYCRIVVISVPKEVSVLILGALSGMRFVFIRENDGIYRFLLLTINSANRRSTYQENDSYCN